MKYYFLYTYIYTLCIHYLQKYQKIPYPSRGKPLGEFLRNSLHYFIRAYIFFLFQRPTLAIFPEKKCLKSGVEKSLCIEYLLTTYNLFYIFVWAYISFLFCLPDCRDSVYKSQVWRVTIYHYCFTHALLWQCLQPHPELWS